MNVLISVINSAIASSAAIMYAACGEVFSERAGVVNLGLEGVMLMGAATAYMAVCRSGSLLIAMLTALGVGALLGLLYAFFTVTLQANQIVAGLSMVTFGSGMASFLGKNYSGVVSPVYFSKTPLPLLGDIPILGKMLFNHTLPVYLLYALVLVGTIYLYKTRPGLKLRALGENPAALDAAGVKVFWLRYLYVILGCAIVALGGAYITLAYTPGWYDDITAGAGWIAAALVIFASWNPAYAVLGAVLFGGVSVLGLRLQAAGVPISSFFISMLPYLCTVLILLFTTGKLGRKHSSAPAMLGKYYDREER